MSRSESVNVDVDSVGHNSEPTTVETRESISNVEMSVTTQESSSDLRVPLPEKLVIPAIPLNSDNSARDDNGPEERLPVPGVDNSNVMVYPPLKSKTIESSEFPIAGRPGRGTKLQIRSPLILEEEGLYLYR